MVNSNAKQIGAVPTKDGSLQKRFYGSKRRIPLSIALTVFGIGACIVSLALVSNRYGNTDTIGLILFGFSGGILVTGICHFFIQLPYAALVGLIAAPLFVAFLFVLFWVTLFATAFQNRDHQDFAANGVSQIQFADQMEELYVDCRHYITYGQNDVPLFYSVAYFGDRYKLTMHVPVNIHSKTSGTITGEPTFFLHEIRKITVSPSGKAGASFSDSLEFGAADWKLVYESNGDFSRIGFVIDPTPVPNFKTYTDATRPSN